MKMKHTLNLVRIVLLLSLAALLCGCDGGKNTTDPTPTGAEEVSPTPLPTVVVDPDARTVTFDLEKQHQTIDGFGAGFTWYSELIFSLKSSQECVDLLFRDAGFTILRFRATSALKAAAPWQRMTAATTSTTNSQNGGPTR